MNEISLGSFKKDKNVRKKNIIMFALWEVTSFLFFKNPLFYSSTLKRIFLVIFGARVGRGVIIKQAVSIKYPWKLKIGDYSWVGEGAWIDNIAEVEIGSDVCISQGAYLCTGNHDWSKKDFPLIAEPITIDDGVWIGAKTVVSPGIKCGKCSVLTAGSVAIRDMEPYKIYQGNPAVYLKDRVIT